MMTLHDIAIVKSTIPVLRESGVALTQHFYQRMLTGHPELKNVFNLSNQAHGRQPRALAAAVLAYAENIEHPEKLAKAVERITTKHVMVDIQPEQYNIVGENLLHSISEVLSLPMDHEIIVAWEKAYGQLADILINREHQLYEQIGHQAGGWAGWRAFRITDKQVQGDTASLTLQSLDGAAVLAAQPGQTITVRVPVADMGIEQPQQYAVRAQTDTSYQIDVTREVLDTDAPSVSNILLDQLHVGDQVQVTAPLSL